ncbi:hypothetical protein [Actinomadura harenae]|nr:hypothetical protein [Actinomadura harenae]
MGTAAKAASAPGLADCKLGYGQTTPEGAVLHIRSSYYKCVNGTLQRL